MERSIELAHTGRRTSRLGFGCSGLMGATSRNASLRLLDAAYDAGIRHFDVAPMYGYGEAESCLGAFLAEHRASVTVTTKFGIAPGRNRPWINTAKRVARELIRQMPALADRLRKAQPPNDAGIPKLPFTRLEAERSLERSLRSLRTEHIDLWLLHEATAADLQEEGLLRFMEDAVVAGKIGAFGVGTESRHVPALLAERPRYCPVLQFQWSVFDAVLPQGSAFRLHHRALTEHFHERHRWMVHDPARCSAWSHAVGRDLRQPPELAALMLRASLECNRESVVLFSSSTPEHIAKNVANSEDASLRGPALLLQQLIHKEGAAAENIL